MRQTVLFARVADSPDNVVRVFIQAIVDRAVRLRTRPFIIHAEAAAHVEALDIHAKLVQLHIEAGGFAHAGGDIADVRHLGAQVEVQQLQAIQTIGFAQHLNQLQHLRRRQAEFRFFAAGRLPFAGSLRGEARTHAEARDHVQALRFFQHDFDFRHLFDDQIDLVAHLLADQRQTNIFTVFITVTDDNATGHTRMRQHRHQLRFRTRFQTQRFAGVDQRFDDATMLVHLNRVNQEVVAVIAVGLAGALKRRVDGTQAMLQDLREAEQCRQALALSFTLLHQPREIDARFGDVRIGAYADMTQFVDVVVVIAPPGNIVSAQHLAGFLGAHCNLLHGT
ncbi:hypothetical protein BN132_1690 [Cronobacter turicensis 564]|nr:hypothetical protein BN132_1690 [Cronobacter turicensis 564]